jgi:outer membrane lipoprotein-sorting protein
VGPTGGPGGGCRDRERGDRCAALVLLGALVLVSAAAGAAALFAAAPPPAAATPAGDPDGPDLRAVMQKQDDLYRSASSYSEVTMEIVTPHWERTLEMRVWTAGLDRTFIRILEPRKEQGVGTLRIGDEMWNYLPKTNKVIKVPPSMMMGSWMGSDFTNDDLVDEFTYLDDYTWSWADVDTTDPGTLYVRCTPKEGVPVVWGHLILALRESDYLPVREQYFDEKGRLMRTMRFSEVRQFGERTLPSVMELVPANKEGNRTIVRYEEAEFDIAVDDDTFTLRNLRSPR